MRRRWTWVAWSMMAVYIAGLACTAGLAVLNGSAAGDSTYTVYLPAFTAFMVVGALVVARRPANPIGWLFSTIGLLALGAHLAHEYFQYASVTRPDAQPFPIGAIWYLAWAAFPVFGLTFTFTLLLFPTGRLPSPRWRPIAWLAGVQITATSVLAPSSRPCRWTMRDGAPFPIPSGSAGCLLPTGARSGPSCSACSPWPA